MMKWVLYIAFLSSATTVQAAPNYLGVIQKVGTRGNGTVFIEFSGPVGLPQCSQSQVAIPASNPASKSILAIAMAAYFSNTRVYIQTDDCVGIYPTMSGQGSWIYPVP